MEYEYKKKPLSERIEEYNKIKKAFPEKIPIIIDKHPNFPNIKTAIKTKFLLQNTMTTIDFKQIFIKTHLQLEKELPDSTLCLTLYCGDQVISEDMPIIEIQEKYKEEDGFVYLKYSYEYKNIFESKYEFECIGKNKDTFLKSEDNCRVIIEKDPNYPYIKGIKIKFVIKNLIDVKELIGLIISKKLKLNENIDSERYLNVILRIKSNYVILSEKDKINTIYDKFKDKDGILYLYYYYEYTLKQKKKQTPLDARINEYQSLKKNYPNKTPIIIERNPNYFNNKKSDKNQFLVENYNTVNELINLLKLGLKIEPPENTQLNLFLIETKNYKPLFLKKETMEQIHNKYKEEDEIVYLQYSYEFTQINNLEIFQHNYKSNNPFDIREKEANEIKSKNFLPMVIETYPKSKYKKISKKFTIKKELSFYDFIKLINKKIDVDNNDSCLITSENVDLRTQGNITMLEIYNKYLEEDGILYLYILESSLLSELKVDPNNEIFDYKKLNSLAERKEEYLSLSKKYKKKFYIRVEKEFDIYDNNNKNENSISECFILDGRTEIDTLKIKIWKKLGQPFLSINLMDSYNRLITFTKISNLEEYREEDNFIYLFYSLAEPNLDEEEIKNTEINEKMSENLKIFYLFKRIPFIFKIGPSFNNRNKETKVFLPYKSKTSTFKTILENSKLELYCEYPDLPLNSSEVMYYYYLKNKKKEDDFLHLTIVEENPAYSDDDDDLLY